MRCYVFLALFFTTALVLRPVSAQTQNMDEKMLNLFFHKVIDSFTNAFNPTDSFVQVALRPIPINPSQFNDLISADNPKGSAAQSEYFSRLVNANGAVANIEQSYSDTIFGARASFDLDPAYKTAYDKAFSILFMPENQTDTSTGVTTTFLVSTPRYNLYKRKQIAYVLAVKDYRINENLLATSSPHEWKIKEPIFNNSVKRTEHEFKTAAPEVKNALDILAALRYIPSSLLFDTTDTFQSTSQHSVLNSGTFHMSFAKPSDFATYPDYYVDFSVSSQEAQVNLSPSYSSWKSSGGFGSFFGFRFDATTGAEINRASRHSTATHMKITGNVTLVRVDRPWLQDTLFHVGDWFIPGLPEGSVSAGDASTVIGKSFPSYCTHIIVVKDLKISGDWSSADSLFYSRYNSADSRVIYGPLLLGGGHYSYQASQEDFLGQTVQDTFVVPGLQVIGWINTIVPYSPQLDG